MQVIAYTSGIKGLCRLSCSSTLRYSPSTVTGRQHDRPQPTERKQAVQRLIKVSGEKRHAFLAAIYRCRFMVNTEASGRVCGSSTQR